MIVLPFLLHFLNMGAVFQHQGNKIQRGRGTIDRSFEPFASQAGKEPGVIYMCMGKKYKIHFCRAVQRCLAVALLNGGVALVHTAIHGETRTGGFNNIAGPCDGAGCAEKGYFHAGLLLRMDYVGERGENNAGIEICRKLPKKPHECFLFMVLCRFG